MVRNKTRSVKPRIKRNSGVPISIAERFHEYEEFVENLEEMIAVVDRDYRFVMANRAFLRHRGMEKEQSWAVWSRNAKGRCVREICEAKTG